MVTGLIDTDIVVVLLRQFPPAHTWMTTQTGLGVTSVVWIEILQGTTNTLGQTSARKLLRKFEYVDIEAQDFKWAIQALTNFHLSHSLMGFDALIAATCYRLQIPLYTRNLKHFTPLLGTLAQNRINILSANKMAKITVILSFIAAIFITFSVQAHATHHQNTTEWLPYDLIFLKLPIERSNPYNDYPPTPWSKGSTSLPVTYVYTQTGEHITFESTVIPEEQGLSPNGQYFMVQTPDSQLCQVNNFWEIQFCLPVNPNEPGQVSYGGVYWASDSQSFRTGKAVKLDDVEYNPVTETTPEYATYMLTVNSEGTILEERSSEPDTIQLDMSYAYFRDSSVRHDIMILTIREDTTPPFPTYVVDTSTGQVLYRLPDEFGLVESRIKISPDGQKLAVAKSPFPGNPPAPNILITSLDGSPLLTIQAQSTWNGRFSSFLGWSLDGSLLFWDGGIGQINDYVDRTFVYSFQTGQIRELPEKIVEATDVSISPDGRYFALLKCELQDGNDICSLTLIDTITGQEAVLVDFSENAFMNLHYFEWVPNNWLQTQE